MRDIEKKIQITKDFFENDDIFDIHADEIDYFGKYVTCPDANTLKLIADVYYYAFARGLEAQSYMMNDKT